MTEIVNRIGVSIQAFTFARQVVPTGGATFTGTLDRAGRFMGCAVALDSDAESGLNNTSIAVRNIDNSELVYGQAISGFEIHVRNGNAGAVNMGAQCVFFVGVS